MLVLFQLWVLIYFYESQCIFSRISPNNALYFSRIKVFFFLAVQYWSANKLITILAGELSAWKHWKGLPGYEHAPYLSLLAFIENVLTTVVRRLVWIKEQILSCTCVFCLLSLMFRLPYSSACIAQPMNGSPFSIESWLWNWLAVLWVCRFSIDPYYFGSECGSRTHGWSSGLCC